MVLKQAIFDQSRLSVNLASQEDIWEWKGQEKKPKTHSQIHKHT